MELEGNPKEMGRSDFGNVLILDRHNTGDWDTLDMTYPLKHGIIIVTGYVPP